MSHNQNVDVTYTKEKHRLVTRNDFGDYQSFHDAPALINTDDGTLRWFKNGFISRDNNLPAVIAPTHISYMVDGLFHRTNGPAVIKITDDKVEYWLNGVEYEGHDQLLAALNNPSDEPGQFQKITLDGKEYRVVPIE